MKMVLALVEAWALPYPNEWAARESQLGEAFKWNARCYTTVICKDALEVGNFCDRCVTTYPGPWPVDATHNLCLSNTMPPWWFCENCGTSLTRVNWKKCERCIGAFKLFLKADRQSNYNPDGYLKSKTTTVDAPSEVVGVASSDCNPACSQGRSYQLN